MPSGPCPTSRRLRSLPGGLLGMLALVVATEAWLDHHERDRFIENVPASWMQAGKAARREAVACDVLCFGDSMVKFGVSPPLLRERAGLRTYNLAGYGGPPALSYFLLRRAIDAGARPRIVIADFMLNMLEKPPQSFYRSWQAMATLPECWDLARTTGDYAFLAHVLIGRALPSVRDRVEIRKSVTLALDGLSQTEAVAHYVTPLWRNWRINRGGQLLAPDPSWSGRANPGDIALFPPDWRADHASVRYMRRFLELAGAHRIQVVWLLPPLSPATQNLRDRSGVEARNERVIRSVLARFPQTLVIDARRAGFDDRVFTDPVHLDRHGTAALTEGIARILTEELTPEAPALARWRPLPPYPDRPIEVPWEDLDQSRLAIQAQESSRRR